MNVPVSLETGKIINIPVDAVIKPKSSTMSDLPVFIEAKSAGDFANVNKRRKEEAVKMSQLRSSYGNQVKFNLFLCGYFDSGYLGYEAAEGIDWVWEHRIDDLAGFGL
jgi:type II restriction enzyme